jgi:hypothetical protein
MAITKRLLKQLKFMLEQLSFEVQQEFSVELLGFLTEEQLLIWEMDKPIDSYIGGELKLFSKNAFKIASWASENDLVSATNLEWTNFAAAFNLWEEMHAFITKAEVKEDDDYEQEIKKFEVEVKQFYEYGRTTFLASKSGVIGSLETSYSHILRFNLAQLARITYQRHKVGIGVFTLQGYERRNKESKNVFVKHSNAKGNLCLHTMKGLTEQYHTVELKVNK